jgi:hypothetical protein
MRATRPPSTSPGRMCPAVLAVSRKRRETVSQRSGRAACISALGGGVSRKDDQLTSTEVTLERTRQVLSELRTYAETEQALAEFVPVLLELEEQARQLAAGRTSIGALTAALPARMPSRDIAINVTAIVSKLPVVEDDFDDAKRLPLARLLENLVVGVTGTIFSEFPDVVPHDEAG